jgi:NADH-quinone oxidoreductase subunit B
MEGLLLLGKAVGQEKRPLAWWVGSQVVEKPGRDSQRDLKRADRMTMRFLRPPTDI